MDFEVPHFPPSVNKLYQSRRGGGKTLSEEARGFINQFSEYMMSRYLPQISKLDTSTELSWCVTYDFHFPRDRVFNKTYGTGTKQAAKTRFAKMDVENLMKLLSDCFSKVIGIDDCQFFDLRARKMVARNAPKIVIHLTPLMPFTEAHGF